MLENWDYNIALTFIIYIPLISILSNWFNLIQNDSNLIFYGWGKEILFLNHPLLIRNAVTVPYNQSPTGPVLLTHNSTMFTWCNQLVKYMSHIFCHRIAMSSPSIIWHHLAKRDRLKLKLSFLIHEFLIKPLTIQQKIMDSHWNCYICRIYFSLNTLGWIKLLLD